MGRLVINQDRIVNKKELIKLCPFNAMEISDGNVEINSACKMCKLCVREAQKVQ